MPSATRFLRCALGEVRGGAAGSSDTLVTVTRPARSVPRPQLAPSRHTACFVSSARLQDCLPHLILAASRAHSRVLQRRKTLCEIVQRCLRYSSSSPLTPSSLKHEITRSR